MKPPTLKQLKNEKALTIYAGFLCGIILSVIAARYLHGYYNKVLDSKCSHALQDPSHRTRAPVFRKLERRTKWHWLGRPSFGHLILAVIYLLGNIALCSTILVAYQVNHWASRFGWMGAANMALCAFFGLKNTPLAPLLHTSHTQLNLLHRFVGYTTILQVFLHAVFYTMHFARKNSWETLVEEGNIEGIFAGVAMLVLLMGILRRWAYELFYASHIAGFITAVVLVGLHRPDWAKKLPVVMLFTASIWMLDRIIQTARMLHSLVNNHATFHPLPDGGTRLILKKPCADAASPGSHCFLWIPRIHIFENHPFTIVSNGPSGLELVMKSHRGFTKAVHSFASRYPSCITWAAVDGPYVSLPDLENYDHLILIAGGSGAAFTFGLMNRIISEPDRFRPHSIQFVWSVRRREHTSWFHDHVQNITRAIPNARTTIYITSDEPITGPNAGICTRVLSGEIQSMIPHESDPHTYGAIPELDGMDGLSTRAAYARLEQIATIKCMKMETEAVICEATRAINNDQRVLVAACGPQSLMDAVRDSAESWRTRLGLRLCIHCEDFNN